MRRLVILFMADLLAGVVFSRFRNGILGLIFLILFAVNFVIFIKVPRSDAEKD